MLGDMTVTIITTLTPIHDIIREPGCEVVESRAKLFSLFPVI